ARSRKPSHTAMFLNPWFSLLVARHRTGLSDSRYSPASLLSSWCIYFPSKLTARELASARNLVERPRRRGDSRSIPPGFVLSVAAGSLPMHAIHWVATTIGLAAIGSLFAPALNGERAAAQARQPAAQPFGLEKRELWTTSKVKGSPEPPDPYTMTRT